MSRVMDFISESVNYEDTNAKNMKKKFVTCKIILIGMPGSGKSYWSGVLKKKLKLPAYDLDTVIEVMDDRTVAEIFSEEGEEYFRKLESKMLHLFAEKKQFILSTGGGTPCYNNNMQWMKSHGITIWLDEPIDILFDRIEKQTDRRPIFKNLEGEKLKHKLMEILNERKAYYEQAEYKLTGNSITEANFVEILNQYA